MSSKRLALHMLVVGIGIGVLISVGLWTSEVNADVINSTWNYGASGNWNTAGNWDPSGVPNNGGDTYNVRIDDDTDTDVTVTLNMNATISSLAIDSGDQLTLDNAHTLTIAGGPISNSGSINFDAALTSTYLKINGDVTLNGGGVLVLNHSDRAYIQGLTSGNRLTNVDNTIEGMGKLGNNSMVFTNQSTGTVDANVSGETLTVDPSSAGSVINSGTMQASGGGTLILKGGNFDNAGGTIQALDASIVELESNANIQGGVLTTAGSGEIQSSGTGVRLDGGTTAGVLSNQGKLKLANSSDTYLSGTITNSGSIDFDAALNSTYLRVNGDVTLNGGGTVTLNHSDRAYIQGLASGNRLTNVDNTIEGMGKLGNNAMSFTNQSMVDANASGGTLTVDPSSTGSVINSGTMQASGGGTLLLKGGIFDNSGGTIQALDASIVELENNANIQGGTLTTALTGEIHSKGSNIRLDGGTTAGALSNQGTLKLKNGSDTYLSGTITNSGSIDFDATLTTTYLRVSGDVTLNGGGTVTMNRSDRCRVRGTASGNRLTNVNNTIEGMGRLGDNAMSFTNQSVVDANTDDGGLTIDPSSAGSVINSGTMQASSGGTLILKAGIFDNSGGTIQALNASIVELESNANIQGGTLTTAGTGEIHSSGTGARLDGTAGGLSNLGTLKLTNGSDTDLVGTITNSGSIDFDATLTTTYLTINGDVTLNGGGVLALNHPDRCRVLGTASGNRLTNVDNTIEGMGRIGNNTMVFTNQGTVDANVSGQTLTVDPSSVTGGVINSGTMQASGGGLLSCTGGNFTNDNLVQATGGGTVTFTATANLANYSATPNTLTGGTWKAFANSTLTLTDKPITNNAADVTLSGVGSTFDAINPLADNQSAGAFHVLDGRTFSTVGDLGNAGEVEIGAASALTVIGTYTQTAGTTIVNGQLGSTVLTDIQGGTIVGIGNVTGPIDLAGTLAPGNSVGTLTFEQLNIEAGASFDYEVMGVTADLIEITGAGDDFNIYPSNTGIGGHIPYIVNIIASGGIDTLGDHVMFQWAGDDPLTENEWAKLYHEINWTPGYDGDWSYHMDTNQIVLTITEAVPEPATMMLLGLGALALLRRRK